MEVRKTLFVFRLFCKCDLLMTKFTKSKEKKKNIKRCRKGGNFVYFSVTGFLENQMGSLEASVVHEIHRYSSYAFCCVL